MKIYEYQTNSDKFNKFLADQEYWDLSHCIGRGSPLLDNWKPMRVRNYFKGKEGLFPMTMVDFQYLSGNVPVVSEKAWQLLQPYIGQAVEALPLMTPAGNYFALNVLDIVDALNKEESQISYNSASGRVSRIFNYVLFQEKIQGKLIFKVHETKGLETYISEEFKKIVEQENLKGLRFEKMIFEYE